MKTIRVTASKTYDVLIGRNLLPSLGEHMRKCMEPCNVCVVTDDTVDALYQAICNG